MNSKVLMFVVAAVLVALACSTLIASHPAGPAEKTGEALDSAGRAIGGAVRDTGKAIGDGASNAYQGTKNAINDNINGAPAGGAVSMLFLAASSFLVIKAAGIFA